MKKNIIIILMLSSLLVLTSCNTDNASDKTNSDVNTSENQMNTSDDVTSDNATTTNNEVIEEETTIEEETVVEEEPENTKIEAGLKIPNFKMSTLEGDTIELSEYEGKIVLLNFWASWCGYCDREMPDLEKVDQDSDVVVIAINSREKKSVVEEYIADGKYDFLTILDEKGVYSDKFVVNSLPTTFFIDEDGILIGQALGMLTLEEMESIIQNIRDDKY